MVTNEFAAEYSFENRHNRSVTAMPQKSEEEIGLIMKSHVGVRPKCYELTRWWCQVVVSAEWSHFGYLSLRFLYETVLWVLWLRLELLASKYNMYTDIYY